jgi:predicted extracellular nuclease
VSPDVVISQVYGGGGNSGAPYTHDFVELFNRGTATVSLNGMSVQYASATGTGNFSANPVVLLSGTVAPGQRYLVQQFGGTTGAPLPTPDATGTASMSGTAGKVALVDSTTGLACNGGSAPCDAGQLALIRDLVGYGGANFFEGAPAPALSNTTAGLRASGGCTDTDNNAADFTAETPSPRNSASTLTPCGTEPVDNPPVVTCPATLIAPPGEGATAPVSATDDIDGIGAISITSAPVTGITLADIDLAAGSAVLTVAASTTPGSYSVVIEFATDAATPQTSTCAVAVTVQDPSAITPIHDVQGVGASSPMAGQIVTLDGIVTSLFQSNDVPDGFFLQEEDADADADPATSEGLFVFCRNFCVGVAVGDRVQATGPVAEFFDMTQVSANAAGRIQLLSSGNVLPTAAPLELPASGSTRAADTFEDIEGMIVTSSARLVVSEYFELARYGQLVLTAGARPYQFTHANAPDAGDYQEFLTDLNKSRIILDDNNNTQNDAVVAPQSNEPYPWPQDGLSLTNRVRGGDYIDDLTGVLHWSFAGQSDTDAWRIRPIDGVDYTFESANPAPASPEDVGGRLTVTSYNVLNYFATIDETSSSSSGPCGPSGTMDCRGADSEVERVRQLTKIVAGLAEIDADVAGLIEIQNDQGAATKQIVDALNEATAPGTYAAIDTGFIGTDAIKVALIYQPGSVTPVGAYEVFDSQDDARFDDTKNRPVLIQTFEENATGARFTIAVNHLKSKGSVCTDVGDPDLGDGQGNCNLTRTKAAQALADFLATDPTGSGDPDFLVVGDLNSYAMEDPITALEAAGYTDLHEQFEGPGAYSYVFDGQLGYLDTALANSHLLRQVTGTTAWHINADEVPLFDYNDEERTTGEASFERESNALPLYAADPLRSSDHDPVIVGLDLLDAHTLVADLRDALADMTIQPGVKKALDATLRSALKAIDADDQPTACASLQSFLDQVTALTGKKISTADAAILTEEAMLAREVLGC